MEKMYAIIFFISLLAIFIIFIKIFLESNIHKMFKQGKVLEIRCFYIFCAFAISTICSIGIVKFIEAIITITT